MTRALIAFLLLPATSAEGTPGEGDVPAPGMIRLQGRERPLGAHLEDLGRQAGLVLARDPEVARSDLERIRLTADLAGIGVHEAVEILCGAAGLHGEVRDGQILVRAWPPGGDPAGHLGKAAECYRRGLLAEPRHPMAPLAYREIGRMLHRMGLAAASLHEYETFVRRFPNNAAVPEALLEMAQAHLALGDPESARAAHLRHIDLYPTSPFLPDARLGLAGLRQGAGDPVRARRALQALVTDHPGTRAARTAAVGLAADLLAGGDPEGCLRLLGEVRVIPEEPETWRRALYAGGLARLRTGDHRAASASARAFLAGAEDLPEEVYGLLLLARASRGLESLGDAVALFRLAHEKAREPPERWRAVREGAILAEELGLETSAERLLEGAPESGAGAVAVGELRLDLARLRRDLGRPARALPLLRDVRGTPALERIARVEEIECHLLRGDPAAAASAARGLRFGPGEDELRARAGNALGDALLRLGDAPGALSAYLGRAFLREGEEGR